MKNPVRLKESCCFIAKHFKGASTSNTEGSLEKNPPSDWDSLRGEGLTWQCAQDWNHQVKMESAITNTYSVHFYHGAELISALLKAGGGETAAIQVSQSKWPPFSFTTIYKLHCLSHILNTGLFYKCGSNPLSLKKFKYEVPNGERLILDPS